MAEKKDEKKVVELGFREKFLSNDEFRKKTVDWNGYEVELKELTAAQRGNVYKSSMVTKTKRGSEDMIQEIDQTKLNVWAVIYQTYDPNTKTKVFQNSDFDALAALPCSVLDTLARPALELLGEEVEEAEKN